MTMHLIVIWILENFFISLSLFLPGQWLVTFSKNTNPQVHQPPALKNVTYKEDRTKKIKCISNMLKGRFDHNT